ncbi:MaoC/PaaZ C-terminal domain-containing protein [Pseudomaricurvus alcaniphilus]|uniref:MaoC/PaaZ C-terminal domain-containing protein n=1 Tax=Pseudomaricurvus alcaniphilus TaxID=1166482 RepID=UPI001A9FD251
MGFEYEKIKNWPIPEGYQDYSENDCILYALGVGAGAGDPAADLNLIYEKNLAVLPTMAVTMATQGTMWVADPKTGIDLSKLLHGEQYLTIHKPLPVSGKVTSRSYVEEIYDKGAAKGAVMMMAREISDADSGELLATCTSAVFLRGNGGCGGPQSGQPVPQPMPERAPDVVIDAISREEQAALYRLTGDTNPLHIDPKFAAMGGFPKPILHGLCTYGFAARAVISAVCDGDPSRLRKFNLRFANPVFPGETLRTEIWKEADGKASFRTFVVERELLVLNNGYAEYDAAV